MSAKYIYYISRYYIAIAALVIYSIYIVRSALCCVYISFKCCWKGLTQICVLRLYVPPSSVLMCTSRSKKPRRPPTSQQKKTARIPAMTRLRPSSSCQSVAPPRRPRSHSAPQRLQNSQDNLLIYYYCCSLVLLFCFVFSDKIRDENEQCCASEQTTSSIKLRDLIIYLFKRDNNQSVLAYSVLYLFYFPHCWYI